MDYRQVTPPSGFEVDDFDTLQCPGGSASTNASYFPYDWSPESVMTTGTAATTPPRSPPKIREIGPTLLPRVRTQDQLMDYTTGQSFHGHSRTVSLPPNAATTQLGGYLPPTPATFRRSTSPPSGVDLPTPGSAPLAYDHMIMDQASRRPSMSNGRSQSSSNVHTHSRNSSSTSIDASTLGRYGFPTYRQSPTPQPQISNSVPMSRTPSAMSHLAPIAMPGGHIQSYPARRRTASPPANPSRLSTEVEFDPQLDLQTSSILEYLAAPNPAPSLTQRTVEGHRAQNTHFWYDIRNVSTWSDFNVNTISDIPRLLSLLQVSVTHRDLPKPGRVNLHPETPAQLAEVCFNHHAVKVNAALKLAQGDKHMAMRTLQSGGGAKPDFVSNYQSGTEQTIFGDGRGRVVGMVKCHDQWNSGMRSGNGPAKVEYLRGLALLQRFMREHECRYGFIMTEIEVVCVRAGGPPAENSNVPLFGYVEVAEAVPMATHGMDRSGNLQMTADLALWYLHMLAKEQPLPGQYHWKMEVGPPTQLTRQHHLPRDDKSMPKPHQTETREAKRVRGWVWPNEPLSRRESGRNRRNRN